MDLLRRSLEISNGCSGYSQPACEITDPVSTAILTEIEKRLIAVRTAYRTLPGADGCWAKPEANNQRCRDVSLLFNELQKRRERKKKEIRT